MLFKQLGINLALILNSFIISNSLPVTFNANGALQVYEKMNEILQSCFETRLKTIIVSPSLVEIFNRPFWLSKMVSTILVQLDLPTESRGNFPGPVNFVLSGQSKETLTQTLQGLRSSEWWNIDGFLVIVHVNSSQECTKMAADTLQVAWKMNLLSSFFLCNDDLQGVTLFTYNPFSNRADYPWIQISNVDVPDDRWTLYKQPLTKGSIHCQTLDFDKTKHMDGYEIKLRTTAFKTKDNEEPQKRHSIQSMKKKTALIDFMVFDNMFAGLNVTPIIHYEASRYDADGAIIGINIQAKNSLYDVFGRFEILNINMSFFAPIMQGEIRLLTQHRRFLRPEEKIRQFYSLKIVYLSCIVLLITVLFIVVIRKNHDLTSAILEVLRMTLSTGILQPLNRISIRIHLICVFHLIIILNATFQGNIAAFLTKPERHNIETMEDLAKYDYKVYVKNNLKNVLPDWTGFAEGLVHFIDRDCTEYVLNDSSTACINFFVLLLERSKNRDLHISSELRYKPYLSLHYRDDWPLKNKVNYNLLRLARSGLIDWWLYRQRDIPMDKLKFRESQQTAAQFRPIRLDDLAFVFKILEFGLPLSLAVFIIEISIKQKFWLPQKCFS